MKKLWIAVYVDRGETCDGKPRVLKACATKEEARDEVRADIEKWADDRAGENIEVDFDKMNPCRYHRAFDRFTMTVNAFGLVKGLSKGNISIHKRIQFGLDYIVNWAKYENINLEWYVRQKMQYNDGRPALHGKKY